MILAHRILHELAVAVTLPIRASVDALHASHVLIHPPAAVAEAVRSEAFLRVDPVALPVLLRRDELLRELRERRRVSVRHPDDRPFDHPTTDPLITCALPLGREWVERIHP